MVLDSALSVSLSTPGVRTKPGSILKENVTAKDPRVKELIGKETQRGEKCEGMGQRQSKLRELYI
jgi:hypothetical protein